MFISHVSATFRLCNVTSVFLMKIYCLLQDYISFQDKRGYIRIYLFTKHSEESINSCQIAPYQSKQSSREIHCLRLHRNEKDSDDTFNSFNDGVMLYLSDFLRKVSDGFLYLWRGHLLHFRYICVCNIEGTKELSLLVNFKKDQNCRYFVSCDFVVK